MNFMKFMKVVRDENLTGGYAITTSNPQKVCNKQVLSIGPADFMIYKTDVKGNMLKGTDEKHEKFDEALKSLLVRLRYDKNGASE